MKGSDIVFVDRVQIHVKGGNGGNGAVSFYRAKYVTNGGPDEGTAEKAEILSSWRTRI